MTGRLFKIFLLFLVGAGTARAQITPAVSFYVGSGRPASVAQLSLMIGDSLRAAEPRFSLAIKDTSAVIVRDTAIALRTFATTAARTAAYDTAGALRTAMGDSARTAAKDTATALRLVISSSARDSSRATAKDTAAALRLEFGPAAAAIVGDSLVELWQAVFDLDTANALGLLASKVDTTRFKSDSVKMADSLTAIRNRAAADSVRLDDSLAAHRSLIAAGSGGGFVVAPLNQSLRNMHRRNVKQLMTLAVKSSWQKKNAFGPGDSASFDLSTYKVDTVGLRAAGNSNLEGASITYSTAADYAHFEGGDTATATAYVAHAIYLDSTSLAHLPPNGFDIYHMVDTVPVYASGFYDYPPAKATFAAGWNYIKTAKSAFTSGGSSPNWGSIKAVSWAINGITSREIRFVVDNLQLVRKDSTDSRPNALWLAGGDYWNGTSSASLTSYRTDTLGIQAMVSGDYVESLFAPMDTMAGRTLVSQTDSSFLGVCASGEINLKARGGNKVLLTCAGGVSDSVAYSYTARDTLSWTLVRAGGGVITATVRKNSQADSTLTGSYSGAGSKARIRLVGNDRLLHAPPALRSNILKAVFGDYGYYVHVDSVGAK